MPTKRRRRPHSRKTEVQPWQIEYLETGRFNDGVGFKQFKNTETDWRDLWATCRDRIMARWIKKHPGTRPWAWWKFDAPAVRKRLSGNGEIFTAMDYPSNFHFGLPTTSCFDEIDPDDPPVYESEAAYLKRYKLLNGDEQKHADFTPVTIQP